MGNESLLRIYYLVYILLTGYRWSVSSFLTSGSEVILDGIIIRN